MANTVVQFKRSTANDVPSILSVGEPAYSFKSGKLFVGNTDGTIIAIGGKYFVDQSNVIFTVSNNAYDTANSAYDTANTGSTIGSGAYDQANTARIHANSAFLAANSAFANANSTHTFAISAFDKANSANVLAFNTGIGANAYTNTVGAAANSWANTIGVNANNYSNVTFVKLTASSQTITGDINITGNLNILGNTTTVAAENLVINDPVILLANNNTTDVVDIGIVAHYGNATSEQVHTGLIRDPGTKQWYLFKEYTDHFFYSNGNIDLSGNNFTIDTLNANFITSNLTLGGANAILSINTALTTGQAAFLAANSAFANGNTTHTLTIASFNAANAAFANGNTTHTLTIAAFDAANAAFANGNTTHTLTVAAFDAANAAFANGNTTHTLTIASFNAANAAFNTANGSSNAENLTSGTIASARLSGQYTGITGVGTITAGIWQGSTVNVAHGGTGMVSFTTNGILYGNATGAIKVTDAGTDGQVLLANPSGVPVFSHLDGGVF